MIKKQSYFEGTRSDLAQELPENPHARILEIGCASGNTGALMLSRKRCGWYAGIEINATAANLAREKLNEVVVGDIESMPLPWPDQSFDVLILSEVLEHFANPWKVLAKLRPLLRPGALLFCSSPNVSYYRIIMMLLRGKWTLEDEGIMDRTHLRWFTPSSYAELVENAGFIVDYVEPTRPFTLLDRIRTLITGGRRHLFIKQMKIRARLPG